MHRLPAPASDVALLAARLLLGLVLLAHGAQKAADLGAAAQGFERLGVPLAGLSVVLAAAIEIVGGVLVLAGAFLAPVGVVVATEMVMAGWFAGEWFAGVVGGWELVGVIMAGSLALAASGPGRFSVAHLLARRRTPDQRTRGVGSVDSRAGVD
jgi:putative oxidoreductase